MALVYPQKIGYNAGTPYRKRNPNLRPLKPVINSSDKNKRVHELRKPTKVNLGSFKPCSDCLQTATSFRKNQNTGVVGPTISPKVNPQVVEGSLGNSPLGGLPSSIIALLAAAAAVFFIFNK